MHLEGRILSGIGNGMAAGTLWGFVFLAPQLLSGFSPTQLCVARYLIYGAFSLLLLIPRWKTLPHLGKKEWFSLGWISLLGNILYYVLLSEAIQLAGGAPTSLIVGLLPVVVTVVGTRSSGAVKLRSLIPPMLLCCIGVGLISYHAFRVGTPGTDFTHKAIGFLCAFCALVSWSAYAIGNSRCLMSLPHISAHEWSLLTGIVTGAIAVIQGFLVLLFGSAPHSSPDWLRFWGISAGVAFFASIVGNRFWNQASRLVPLTLIGQMLVFETLFALLYCFLWERRCPSWLEVWAIFCLISGVVWCASEHRSVPENQMHHSRRGIETNLCAPDC
ncbi:DMT family transporter [Telmatobacter bradus]|uniref:DMT family transporter n=1 Tax=Telmatobacter bradus TaxID=474953 RepID=UPI003B43036F